MRKILIAFLLVLLISTYAFAWSLVCDPQTGVAAYDVEINGVVTDSNHPAEGDGSIHYNIDHLGPGPHIFRLRAYDTSGWGSDWSVPFDALKPGAPGNAKIVKDAGD